MSNNSEPIGTPRVHYPQYPTPTSTPPPMFLAHESTPPPNNNDDVPPTPPMSYHGYRQQLESAIRGFVNNAQPLNVTSTMALKRKLNFNNNSNNNQLSRRAAKPSVSKGGRRHRRSRRTKKRYHASRSKNNK